MLHTPPAISDVVHYCPPLNEPPGCRAAIVTDIHVDPQLATLMVMHPTGVQFLHEVHRGELGPWDKYEPGTWHGTGHR